MNWLFLILSELGFVGFDDFKMPLSVTIFTLARLVILEESMSLVTIDFYEMKRLGEESIWCSDREKPIAR